MDGNGFSQMGFQKFRANIACRFFAAFVRGLKIALIIFFGAHCAACKDKAEQARLQAAAKKAWMQAAEEARLLAADEEERQLMMEEARLQRERDEARKSARAAAAGSKMDVLQTLDGKSYENVEIREVSDIGISIRHDSGVARVPFESLPQEMQERFHFDPQEKEKALGHEQKLQAANAKTLDAAQTSMRKDHEQRQLALDQNRRKELQASLSIASSRVRQLEIELYSIQSELRSDLESTRRTSDYYRPRGVSRAPMIRERLEAKQRQLSAVRNKEAQLRAELMR